MLSMLKLASNNRNMNNFLRFVLISVLAFAVLGLQRTFAQQSGGPEVVITEIMYNPPESGQDSLEFLELHNPYCCDPMTLDGFYFSSGIEYVFTVGTEVAAEGFLILAKDSVAFESVFGMPARQWTSMSLDNDGEAITLRNSSGSVRDTVEYNDVAPWPTEANGGGYSLALCDPLSNNNDVSNWGITTNNTGLVINGITIYADPGALSNCVTVGIDDAVVADGFSVYPNPSNGIVSIGLAEGALTDNAEVSVYDALGQMVLQRSINGTSTKLDLTDLAGIYLIEVTTGNARFTERILLLE